jgi:hypothetical protein
LSYSKAIEKPLWTSPISSNWYATLHQFLLKNGFSPSTVEPGVYFQQPQTGRKTGFTIIMWVGNILLLGQRPEINAMKSKISLRFKVKKQLVVLITQQLLPDSFSFAAGMLGRYSANPSKVYWEAVKKVLKYLKKILHYGLELGGGIEHDLNQLEAYGDADFAGDQDELKSITRFVVIDRHGSAVAWNSTKQKIIGKSTAAAEFTATAFAIEEAV